MRDVFSEIVDYAGLFPPATATMVEAIRSYHGYRASPDRWMLGRFVVASSRLAEFTAALQEERLPSDPGDPWRLSVVLGVNVAGAMAEIAACEAAWSGRGVVVDAVECKVGAPGQIGALAQQIGRGYQRFFEVPNTGSYRPLIAAIAEAGAFAKVRTGGTTPELFPTAEQLTLFLLAVTHRGVPFKATAGLHHPVRGSFPLTYAVDAERYPMYGFVNVLLATAELARGGDGETAQAILESDRRADFQIGPDQVTWRSQRYSAQELVAVRTGYFLGFGSCSFREPVDELQLEVRA